MVKPLIMGPSKATFQEEIEMETDAKISAPYSSAMSLRIWHPRVLSDEITRTLGLTPSLHKDVGALRTTPAGQALDGVYAQTYWLYKFGMPKGTEVEECISNAIDALSSKRAYMKHLISTGGRCELFIGVFLEANAGIEIGGDLVQRVADAGLGLSFDVYLPGD
jgi:hypothetical protein